MEGEHGWIVQISDGLTVLGIDVLLFLHGIIGSEGVFMSAFYFHFNKPATQRAGKVQVSLHYKDTCHVIDNIDCRVPVRGRIRKTQPRFVMAGKAKSVRFEDGVAVIE